MSSNAISLDAVSAVMGYKLIKGVQDVNGAFLPQDITILGEANTANQGSLSTTRLRLTSAKKAATEYGYGSPIAQMAETLFAAGVRVPIYVLPQAAPGGAAAKVITVTPTGTATGNYTHYLIISGKKTTSTGTYAFNVEEGDDATAVCDKMRACIAAVLSCPTIGTGTSTFINTAKWKGLSSNDIKIRVDTNGNAVGMTYAVVNTTAGSGTPSVTTSLAQVGNAWDTIFVNGYGFVDAVLDELEAFNGVPDNDTPTGRYIATLWKPILALCGTVVDDPTSLTSPRSAEVTVCPCVAPLSESMPFEVAASWAAAFANMANNAPQTEIIGARLFGIAPPVPNAIPAMNEQLFREYCVKNGCSTVELISGIYHVVDFVTTYNPEGEYPVYFRYPRDLNIYFNLKYRQRLLEQTNLYGKTLMQDKDLTTADNVVKPKMWIADVSKLLNGAAEDALITGADLSIAGIEADFIGNRVETSYPVTISSIGREISTTVTATYIQTT